MSIRNHCLVPGFKKIIANKGYEGEIHLLSDPCHPATSTRCTKNCTRCLQHMHNSVPDKEISSELSIFFSNSVTF